MNKGKGLHALLVLSVTAACGPTPEVVSLNVPAAGSSMAPNLSVNENGSALLSWIETQDDESTLRFSRLGQHDWEPSQTISSGDNWFVNWADFPAVLALTDTRLAAHWLVRRPAGGYAYDIHAAISTDAGASWSEPFIVHDDGTDTEHGFVSLFADSTDLGMLWLDGRKMINEFDANNVRASGMTLRAGVFGKNGEALAKFLVDDLVCDCCQTDVALTADGPIAIYRNRTVDETRDIYLSRRIDNEWQPGSAVYSDEWSIAACPVNGPTIEAQNKTAVAAWFTAGNDAPAVKVAWSEDAGQTFAPPVLIDSENPLGHVGTTLLPDGDLVISWIRSDGAGGGNLLLKRVSANGEMGHEYAVEAAKNLFAFSVPQLGYTDSGLILAWTEEIADAYRIGSARIPLEMLD